MADRVIPLMEPQKALPAETHHKKIDGIKNGLKKVLNSNILLRSAAASYQQKMLKNIINLIGINKKEHIMVINNPYEWRDILQNLSDSDMPILFLNESIIGNRQKKYNAPEIESNELCLEFFANMTRDGFYFSHILGDRIKWIIEAGPFAARAIIEKIENIWINKMLLAVLMTSTPYYSNYILKQFFCSKISSCFIMAVLSSMV